MTIQRKCMLTALVALSVMGSGSAFAAPYLQSFESWTNGTIINTKLGWASGPNDLSVITNRSPIIPACGAPIADTHTNVLRLSTEDTILTNLLDSGGSQPFDLSSVTTYVETMVQFVPSEDAPAALPNGAVDKGIKAAIYANADTNLVIYHGVLSEGSPNGAQWQSNTNEPIIIPLVASNWYRLTVKLDATGVNPYPDPFTLYTERLAMFQVLTNGVAVQSANAYGDNWKAEFNLASVPTKSATGTWFPFATGSDLTAPYSPRALSNLCFQGTGYLDDLVVTTTDPFALGGPIVLTIIFGSNGHASTGGVNFVSSPWPVSVASGGNTSVVYTAMEWYRIQALTNDATLVTAATDAKCYTQHFNNVTVPATNYVTFYAPPATNFNVSYTNVTTAWLASWGHPDNTSPYDNQPLTLQQQYLLDVDPFGAVTNDFRVTSIAVTQNTNVAVTVGLWINSINHTNINGKLILEAKDYLTNLTWSTFGTAELSGQVFTNGVVTYNFVDTMSNRFYRANITP